MEARGTRRCRKKITASPPSPTKSGPPRTMAERSRISETAKGAGRKRRPEERKATAAAVPAAGAAAPKPPRQPVGKTPQREVPPIPRRERSAEKPDPEGGVLHEHRRTGDAGPPELAAYDLDEGKSRHPAQEKERDRVLVLVEERPRASARDGTDRRVHRLPGGRPRTEAFAPPWAARDLPRDF